jgi:hypothetical protein
MHIYNTMRRLLLAGLYPRVIGFKEPGRDERGLGKNILIGSTLCLSRQGRPTFPQGRIPKTRDKFYVLSKAFFVGSALGRIRQCL